MLTIIGQDIISGNMGYIGTEPGRLYRMGPRSKVAEASGEPPVVLADCKKKPLKGLKIYGKSKQVTTTGAQLLEKDKVVHPPNGKVSTIVLFEGELSGTYTVSCALEGDVKYPTKAALEIIVDGVDKFCTANNHTVVTGMITKITCFAQNTYCDFTGTLNIMLNAGSTPLPWEPYTGGQPSPSPEYPQEIESAGQDGEIGVEVYGGNLFNARTAINGKVVDKHTGSMLSNSRYACSDYIAIPCNAVSLYQNGGTKNQRAFYDSDKNFIAAEVSVNPVTVPKNAKYIRITSEIDKQDMNSIMLSISSTAIPYEPYHEPQFASIATPNGLPGIPVVSGGNYTDADGRQWICDEVDFARGMYVQRIAKKLLTSTGKYTLSSTILNKERILISDISANTVLPAKTADTIGAVMTDFLFAKSANQTYTHKEGISVEITGHIAFYVETIQTVEQAQEYFKDNPMTLYYALITPVETPLTSDQLAAYKQLHTYKGTTIIDNNAGAYMSVKYNT